MSSHLTKADAHLLGVPRPSKKATREISSSSSIAFASQLSSLINSSSTTRNEVTRGRARPSSKEDIFTSHNRGAKKRALKDLQDDGDSKVFRQDLGAVDDSTLHRSKRKMEEKARLYAAMKRGDYVSTGNESTSLIDFDRKWAENEASGRGNEAEVLSSSEDEWEDSGGNEMVDYTDEYGRARRGTKAEVARFERKRRNQLLGAEELDRMSARPVAPTKIIYGDTVQSAAFNPDEEIERKMEEIARKRDRSMTPPEAVHYDGNAEIRSKGVGFFNFSKDESIRKKEMEALEKERVETDRIRREREEKKAERIRQIEARRREIGQKRARKQADDFLDGLSNDLTNSGDTI